jgi:hypothetical protein
MKFDRYVRLILEAVQEKYLILLPGGYKPPTAGHMHMIEEYNNNPQVEKIFVLIGTKEREGITRDQSVKVFKDVYHIDHYKKVTLVDAASDNPMVACFDFLENINNGPYAGQFKNLTFAMGASNKGDDATRSQKFAAYFINHPDVLPDGYRVGVPPIVNALESQGGEALSATKLRQAIKAGNKNEIAKYLPTGVSVDRFLSALTS